MVFAIFPVVFPWFWRPSVSASLRSRKPRPGDVVAVEVEGIGRLENTMLGDEMRGSSEGTTFKLWNIN